MNRNMYIPLMFTSFFIFILLPIFYSDHLSYAQWVMQPLPLPGHPGPECCSSSNLRNDTTPPKIIIITNILHEGNNVLKLKIEDESPLKLRGINFTQGNKNIETYLAKKQNQEYIALVKVVPPFTEIQVRAVDVNDNSARLVQQIKVENWFNMIISAITNAPIWKNTQSLFGENR